MKKIYTLFVAAAAAFTLNAQVNVTFQVDMTGQTVKTVKIAGSFGGVNATSSGTAIPDWTPPSSPKFTKVAGTANTWQTVITFPNASKGQEILFKFMNTDDSWGDCNVNQECFDAVPGDCNQGSGDFNRVYKVPTASAVYAYKFNTCTKLTSNAKDLALDADVSIAPNPANDFTVVKIANGTSNYTVEVINIAGQIVKTYSNIYNQAIIEGLEAGMYFVKTSDESGKFNTQKLVVE